MSASLPVVQAERSHAERAALFLKDDARVHWHDQAVWFVRAKRDRAAGAVPEWERLRETAADFGEQRIYASHKSIMFSRSSCYFFVRPKRKFLEVCVFLGRKVNASQVRRVDQASKSKIVHVIHIKHRDEVEAPITDWLREAYELGEATARRSAASISPRPDKSVRVLKRSRPR